MRTTLRNPFSLFILLLSLCLFVPGAQAAVQSERGGSLSLTLSPETPTVWHPWRPVYNATATFVATLSGNDATQSLSDVTYTFTLSEVSSWPGYCMNMVEETASEETASAKDLKSCPINGGSGEGGRVGQAAAGRGCPANLVFLRFSSVLPWKGCNVSLTHV